MGVTDVNPDPGRPTSESWSRFPAWVALEADAHRCVPHGIVVRVVIAGSGVGLSDIQISHIRSILDSYVESKDCQVE